MNGAMLPAALITVKHLETGLTRTDESDADGNFSIASLPVGAYEISAEKMGSSGKSGAASSWWWLRKRW